MFCERWWGIGDSFRAVRGTVVLRCPGVGEQRFVYGGGGWSRAHLPAVPRGRRAAIHTAAKVSDAPSRVRTEGERPPEGNA
ncbi:hypothetical protein GCM10018772_14940 [Streptomyces fumanus]|uniref:Uncharacterized protein n=1 Tax=Streptomyces fumanus TaxID=67302 RepID=A0A919DWM3_9ACTN|nr:hypothetical protein GCM10018772_14940 [Streptomyces fumanus]